MSPRALLLVAAVPLGPAGLGTYPPVAAADEPGPTAAADERLARLERALEEQAAATERLRREFDAYRQTHPPVPPLTDEEIRVAIDGYLAAYPASAPVSGPSAESRGVRWGGYASLEFFDGRGAPSRFQLERLVLSAAADVTDRIDLRAEIEIEDGGVSDEIDGEVSLEQAQIAFHVADAFTPKLGWLLIPFGRYNLHHDDPGNDFTRRPFTATYLVPTGFGQPGVGAEGSLPLGARHLLSYDVALTNGYRDDFTADEGVGEARQAADENDGKQVWGRVAVTWDAPFVDTLETGVSGTWGIYDERDRDALTGLALDLLARRGPLEVKGEYVAYDYRRHGGDPPDAIRGQSGLWAEADWHFFPGFWRGARGCLVTDTSLLTAGLRYQWMDLDDRSRGATFEDDLQAWSVGLDYRLTERTVFRVDHTWYLPLHGEPGTEWSASFSTYF